jgi:general secretion pathway protein D
VDVTPRVHENGEVSLHIELEISSITGEVNLGGINEPVIGQRKVTHDIRVREGEVSLLGGLINQQESKTMTGIPGLSGIPLIGKLFSGSAVDQSRSELMIALIPHIVRGPDISPSNLRPIDTGNGNNVKLTYGAK